MDKSEFPILLYTEKLNRLTNILCNKSDHKVDGFSSIDTNILIIDEPVQGKPTWIYEREGRGSYLRTGSSKYIGNIEDTSKYDVVSIYSVYSDFEMSNSPPIRNISTELAESIINNKITEKVTQSSDSIGKIFEAGCLFAQEKIDEKSNIGDRLDKRKQLLIDVAFCSHKMGRDLPWYTDYREPPY